MDKCNRCDKEGNVTLGFVRYCPEHALEATERDEQGVDRDFHLELFNLKRDYEQRRFDLLHLRIEKLAGLYERLTQALEAAGVSSERVICATCEKVVLKIFAVVVPKPLHEGPPKENTNTWPGGRTFYICRKCQDNENAEGGEQKPPPVG